MGAPPLRRILEPIYITLRAGKTPLTVPAETAPIAIDQEQS
jgi:hypothetical protein